MLDRRGDARVIALAAAGGCSPGTAIQGRQVSSCRNRRPEFPVFFAFVFVFLHSQSWILVSLVGRMVAAVGFVDC